VRDRSVFHSRGQPPRGGADAARRIAADPVGLGSSRRQSGAQSRRRRLYRCGGQRIARALIRDAPALQVARRAMCGCARRGGAARANNELTCGGDEMARLPSITSKDQVAAKDRDTFDSIVASRGAVQGPFTMFLHSPEVAGRVADLGAYVRFEGSLDMKVRVL